MSWQDRLWAGFEWSKWAPLSGLSWSDVPEGKGLYRIRSVSPHLIAYVGQGNLKSRVVGTWRRASRQDHHEFSRHKDSKLYFLALNRNRLGGYEASWTKGPPGLSSEKRRKAHEDRVLWRYRREVRESALANYGRTTPDLDVVGQDGHVGTLNPLVASSQPVEPCGHPAYKTEWMGLPWSHLAPKEELKSGGWRDADGFRLNHMWNHTALYKALGPRLRLRKVGYMKSPAAGVFRIYRSLPERTVISWTNLGLTPKHECLELVSDLIGAYFEQTGRIPEHQF